MIDTYIKRHRTYTTRTHSKEKMRALKREREGEYDKGIQSHDRITKPNKPR
jgi:hypothetical protein